MSEISFMILKIVVSICAALISVYAVPYLKRLADDKKVSDILTAVETAVHAAEQTIKGDGKGEEKKKMAIEYASSWLNNHGVKITDKQLDGLIEAAVYELKS